ncbi:unnamed protein product [Nippostrongylus brasiliensis]|uniref:BHLH domain-containing protein n=1 Tax=Nippostrongylus brasiliensis TaxID=27835 RepID=A0A0N4YRI6_NIPBR|nr:unnamed protein product [Nippostrongylus brasiliensis]
MSEYDKEGEPKQVGGRDNPQLVRIKTLSRNFRKKINALSFRRAERAAQLKMQANLGFDDPMKKRTITLSVEDSGDGSPEPAQKKGKEKAPEKEKEKATGKAKSSKADGKKLDHSPTDDEDSPHFRPPKREKSLLLADMNNSELTERLEKLNAVLQELKISRVEDMSETNTTIRQRIEKKLFVHGPIIQSENPHTLLTLTLSLIRGILYYTAQIRDLIFRAPAPRKTDELRPTPSEEDLHKHSMGWGSSESLSKESTSTEPSSSTDSIGNLGEDSLRTRRFKEPQKN